MYFFCLAAVGSASSFRMEEKGKRRISEAKSESLVLDDDLLLEILIRLPDSRSVIRCSAVCKQWSSLIKSPRYKELKESFSIIFRLYKGLRGGDSLCDPLYEYFSGNPKLIHGISSSSSKSDNNYLSFLPGKKVRIFASFRDLLLVKKNVGSLALKSLMICNPLTKQWLELPEPPDPFPDWVGSGGLVLSENIKQNHQYNFKVIIYGCVSPCYSRYQVATFCSKTRNWTKSPFRFSSDRQLNGYASVCCNGMVCCLEGDRASCIFDRVIAFYPFKYFNHSKHCRFIDFPSDFAAKDRQEEGTAPTVRLGAVRGQLRLSQLLLIDKRSVLKVWELNYNKEKDDGDFYPWSWTLVHDVEVRIIRDVEVRSRMLFLVAFDPEDGDVVFLSRQFDGQIYRYDIGEEKTELVGKFPNDGNDIEPINLHVYTLTHPIWPTLLPSSV